MNAVLTNEEILLLGLLKAALTGEKDVTGSMSFDELQRICRIAESNSVLPLLWPVLEGSQAEKLCRPAAQMCTAQFYHLLVLSRRCVRLLSEAGIETVVLKGPGTAWYYPVPDPVFPVFLLPVKGGQIAKSFRLHQNPLIS